MDFLFHYLLLAGWLAWLWHLVEHWIILDFYSLVFGGFRQLLFYTGWWNEH